jgi:Zn finger protein HypA/HybF involved in hydrogenase expression
MQKHAFYPDGIINQIRVFFGDVHDMSGFYLKLSLLNGLCRHCDGRGYLEQPDRPCPQCQASGSTDVWRRVPQK